MKASELHAHMQKVGTWVDWSRANDKFLAGDPEAEVRGVAVGWMPTIGALSEARRLGANVFVTHEPLYVSDPDPAKPIRPDHPWVRKKAWLAQTQMIVYRCHDVWDDFPEIGIHGAWARWLGFADKPLTEQKWYEVHRTDETTLEDLARRILKKVKPIGQEVVHMVGWPEAKVSRIALGTGAITNYAVMREMGADVLLLTDDGTRLWESAQWSFETGIPLLLVNHATAEEPGMITLADYIAKQFPGVPVHHIPVGCLYRTVGGATT
jgi:putative NIF3 family GTP cyclohydrolase 1 type 2